MLRNGPRKLLVLLVAVAMVGSALAIGTTAMSHTGTDSHTQENSYLRVVHASPDAPAVDVFIENETVLSDVSFSTVSDYLKVTGGTYNVTIAAAENNSVVVFDDQVTIEPRTVTTVAATGEITENASTTFEPVFYNDYAVKPGMNESALRIIHLSPDAPMVDITAGNGSVVLADNVSFQESSGYVSVPAGDYTAEIRAATQGNNGTVVTTADVSLSGGTAYTAMALGYLNTSGAPAETPFQVMATEDASSSVNLPAGQLPAAIRVVHLSPDAPTVDVTAGNGSVVLADNISYQDAGEYVVVPAGDYTAEIRAATDANNGTVVTTVDVSLEGGTSYSAVATGFLEPDPETDQPAFEVMLLEDGTDEVRMPLMMDEEASMEDEEMEGEA